MPNRTPAGWPPLPPHYHNPAPPQTEHPQHAVDVALLRQGMDFMAHRLQAHSGRIEAIDERVRKMGSRMGKAEDQISSHGAKLAGLETLPASVSEMRTRMDLVMATGKYAAGALLLIAASAGRIPWEHALKLLGK